MFKIAFNSIGLKSNTGGVESYIYNVIKHILINDNENKYFLFIGNNSVKVFNDLPKEHNNLKIIVYPIDSNNSTIRILTEHLLLPLGLVKHRIDLVHHLLNYIPRVSPIKSIVTIHDLSGFFYYKNFPEVKVMRKYYNYLKREVGFTVKKASKIIAISNFTKNELLQNYDIKENKICVIGQNLDIRKKFYEINENVIKKYQLNKPYLLSVSVVRPHKNYDFLIKVFNKLKNDYKIPHQLVIVGGIQINAESFFEEIEKSHYKADIKYLGYVPNSDLGTLYNFADIYVCPSLYEGFGIPIMEAMQYKLPIACSHAASLPEVGEDSCIYFDPYNIDNACEKLKLLIENNNLRETIVSKQLERLEYYNWNKIAHKLLALYTGILDNEVSN